MTLPIQLAAENPLAKVSTLPIRLDGENTIETKVSRPSQCLQPKKTGPCRALSTFYFFDVNKEKCAAFNYGGCEVFTFYPIILFCLPEVKLFSNREMTTDSQRWTSVAKLATISQRKVVRSKHFFSCQLKSENLTLISPHS